MTEPRLTRNRAQCMKCKEVLESHHRHDFVWCYCRSIFIDGGLAYLRRGGDLDAMFEMSEWEDS